MTETQSQNQIVAEAKNKFSLHQISGKNTHFAFPIELEMQLSNLRRDLEWRRQQGTLLDFEENWLGQIDNLYGTIARFNHSLNGNAEHLATPAANVYNMQTKSVSLDEQAHAPYDASISGISDSEADQIISGINKQFEEKILGAAPEAPLRKKSIAEIAGESETNAPGEPGRDLNDFLKGIHQDGPTEPFADDDSNFDLAKLNSGDGNDDTRPAKDN